MAGKKLFPATVHCHHADEELGDGACICERQEVVACRLRVEEYYVHSRSDFAL